jgi:hypothetical protein
MTRFWAFPPIVGAGDTVWLIPLLVLGAFVVAAASRSPRETLLPVRQLPTPGVSGAPPGVPGPIAVLGALLRRGQYPPPLVVLCAIAEAEAIGRRDLASDIVSAFVAPVVYQHQRERGCFPGGPGAGTPVYERGSCALFRSPRVPDSCASRSPRAQASYGRESCAPRESCVPRDIQGSCASRPSFSPTPPVVVPQVTERVPSEDDIFAMLHTDPKAFVDMVAAQPQRRGPLVEIFPLGSSLSSASADTLSSSQMEVIPAASSAAVIVNDLPASQTGQLPENVVQMQEAAGLYEAAEALGPGSPLPGVPDDAWRQFVALLARESPMFSSSRHVGQYRQRRERLAEFGVDPYTIQGSAAAQRQALDTDLADAHYHAAAGGVLAKHLGRPIVIPGHERTEMITLSGVLGVIQCAGLDGAVSWLESSNDRKRYPHTTQAFFRTNGVF